MPSRYLNVSIPRGANAVTQELEQSNHHRKRNTGTVLAITEINDYVTKQIK